MSWRDRLRPASFRGVEFFVQTIESEYGRRQVTHTAALVDVPTLEDLGRADDQFQVEGYLVGDDYDLKRDELIKAIRDTAGPGRLIHPYQGEKMVGASGFRIREQNSEGRMCRFVVTFGEAGSLNQPTEVIDAPNVLDGRADAIKEVSEDSFIDKFLADGFPQYVRDGAVSTLGTIGEYLAQPAAYISGAYSDAAGVFGKVNGLAAGAVDFIGENVSSYAQSVGDFLGGISELVDTPGDLASRLTGLIGGVRSTFGSSAGSILSGLLSLFPRSSSGDSTTYGSGGITTAGGGAGTGTGSNLPSSGESTGGAGAGTGSGTGTGTGSGSTGGGSSSGGSGGGTASGGLPAGGVLTASRAQIITNHEAIVSIVRQTAAAELAVVAVSKNYDTIDDAIEVRDTVAAVIDSEAEATDSDPVYQQLTQARAEVIASIPSIDQSRARVVPYTPPATLPALVIAQNLYADASRAEQIVTRNPIRHPGFVPRDTTLEVISNA